MSQHYSSPERADDPHALPDVEVFYQTHRQAVVNLGNDFFAEWQGNENELAGWYWWSCFPGCLPDGDPVGPYETEADALEASRDYD